MPTPKKTREKAYPNRIGVSLSDEDVAALWEIARSQGIPVSVLGRVAIRDYCQRYRHVQGQAARSEQAMEPGK